MKLTREQMKKNRKIHGTPVPVTRTLCWKCKNAVPDGCYGCSWSKEFEPVEGWVAEEDKIVGDGEILTSYRVIFCPEFIKEE